MIPRTSRQNSHQPLSHRNSASVRSFLRASLSLFIVNSEPARSYDERTAVARIKARTHSPQLRFVKLCKSAMLWRFVRSLTRKTEGVGFEPTVGFPTLDFESSALNRTQPPFQSLDIVDLIFRMRNFLANSASLYDWLPLSYTRPNSAVGFVHRPVRAR